MSTIISGRPGTRSSPDHNNLTFHCTPFSNVNFQTMTVLELHTVENIALVLSIIIASAIKILLKR